MASFKTFVAWLWRYLLTTAVVVTATSLIVLGYSSLASKPFLVTLFWIFLLEGLVLTAVGIVTGLSTSEYRYVGRGAINPPTMRAGMEHFRRGPDPTGWGMLLGLVGLTIVFVAFFINSQLNII